MVFRPTRRQLLSSLAVLAGGGAASPLVVSSLQNVLAAPPVERILVPAPTTPYITANDIRPLSNVRQNTHPIILVHGLGGFITLLNFPYWGGFHKIVPDLANFGYNALPVQIGTFSSNWDRTCELYAQIKGGTVDYGLAHARKFGHARYGRTYPGLAPQWGEVDPRTGKINKVHLIGHSMGGQTIRQLPFLLAEGSEEERVATPRGQLSPLFAGGKGSWLDGIVSISGTHNGSTAIYFQQTALPFLIPFLTFLAAAQADHLEPVYDLVLDQWGLGRRPGEALRDYINRIEHSPVATTKDNASWDLNPAGAAELNGVVKAQPGVYHFSLGTLQTFQNPQNRHQLPDITMIPAFDPFSIFMGKYTQSSPVVVDSSWWPNDGLVSINEMAGPTVNSNDVIVPYNGAPARGQWNYLGTMKGFGHTDIVGWSAKDVRPLYRNLAALLASLPQ